MRLLQVRLLLLLLLRWAGGSVPAVAAHAAGEMRSLAEAGRSSRAEFGGGIGCECIEVDHQALITRFPESNVELNTSSGCLRSPHSHAEGMLQDEDATCFPPTYGSGVCRAWDATLPPYCADEAGTRHPSAEPNCGYAWCFVNATQCRRSSTLFSASRMYPTRAELFYSYDTCIAHDDTSHLDWPFRRYESWRQLSGRRLRIGVPYMAKPFYYKLVDEQPVVWTDADAQAVYTNDTLGEWTGIAPHFMRSVLQQTSLLPGAAPASYQFTWTSVGTRGVHKSMFTACVHDVQNGLLDLCVGDFWLTPERLELAPFTTPVTLEHLHLFAVSKSRKQEKTLKRAAKVYEVFSESLWVTILVGAVSAGLLDVWLNNAWKPAKEIWSAKSRNSKAMYFFEAWTFGIFRFFFDFVAGGPDPQEAFLMPWPSRLLKFGWGFFVLVALTSYTANLAAFLTRTAASEASVVSSMSQAVEQGLVICSHEAIRELLVSEYDEAWKNNLFRWYANTDAVLQGFKDRECELLTASIEAIELSPSRMSFCCAHNLASIGVLTTIPVAFPASPAVVNAVSFWITQTQQPGTLLEQGPSEVQATWTTSIAQFKPAQPECSVLPAGGNAEGMGNADDLTQLTWQHLLGPILSLVFFAGIAIVLKLILKWKLIKRRLARVKSQFTLYTPTGSTIGFSGGWSRRASADEVVGEPAAALDIDSVDPSVDPRVAFAGVGPTPPVEQREARLSDSFQSNMLQSMYGPLRSTLSGVSSSSQDDQHDEQRAHPPASIAEHNDVQQRHGRKRDVYQFTGNSEFLQTARKSSGLPEDMCTSFEHLRQLLETTPVAVARGELIRTLVAMEHEFQARSRPSSAEMSRDPTLGGEGPWVARGPQHRADDEGPFQHPPA